MKYFILLLILFGFSFSQEYEDVIYLKDGSEIHGMIIEQKPNEYIKIKSGSNIFVYQMDEIDRMTKEISDSPAIKFNSSVQVGFGTHRSLSLIAFSKDFPINDYSSFFVTLGLGSTIGGIGISSYGEHNNNGLNASVVVGFNLAGISINGNAGYQFKISDQIFIFAGGMTGFFNTYDYYGRYVQSYVLPVISIDYRF